MEQLHKDYVITEGPTSHNRWVVTLFRKGTVQTYVKAWFMADAKSDGRPSREELLHQIEIDDVTRWFSNTDSGAEFEISEAVYYEMLLNADNDDITPISFKLTQGKQTRVFYSELPKFFVKNL